MGQLFFYAESIYENSKPNLKFVIDGRMDGRTSPKPYAPSTIYPQTKSDGYSFGIFRASVNSVRPHFLSVWNHISVLIGQFDLFLVQMISTMDSQYPISLVKINPLTFNTSYCPCFSICNYKAEPIFFFV